MNYADPLVDRGVCAQGLRFFSSAFKTSSFASVVVKLRREADRARQCWVNGRLRPPILEEKMLLLRHVPTLGLAFGPWSVERLST